MMTAEELATAGNAAICDDATAQVRCHARAITDNTGCPKPNPAPVGFGPRQLRSAYKISGSGSSSTTIAIIDAFGYPTVESDLATYRAQFGLPACTIANGCLRVVNQDGGTDNLPPPNLGWEQESALDLDMASAICPNCKLLLVEATIASFEDLAIAADTAARLGAHVINNSYGGDETFGSTFESYYNHPGVAVTASSGDVGFGLGVEFPSSSPHVTAVGGTTLATASNFRGWSETAWSGAGSGCSFVFAKPSWQHDTGCTGRTVADVSAVADPNTGVAAYAPTSDTTSDWLVFGGTSVAAPIIAGAYGVNGGRVNFGADPYSHTSALFDVRSGTTGFCDPTYLCTAGRGYDGPTGLGTPNGTAAF
jgi:subtilase family serine protease